jgi:hypothetical protein
MTKDNVLFTITANREKEEIAYRIDCSNKLTNEEVECHLEEIIKGICKWKKYPKLQRNNQIKEKKHVPRQAETPLSAE